MNRLLTALLAGAALSLGGMTFAAHHEGDSQHGSDTQTQAQPQQNTTQGADEATESGRDAQAEADDPELFAKLKKCDEDSLNDKALRECIRKAKKQGNQM